MMAQVKECLGKYQAIENLTGDERYFCENCGEKRDAKRQIVVTKMPKVSVDS